MLDIQKQFGQLEKLLQQVLHSFKPNDPFRLKKNQTQTEQYFHIVLVFHTELALSSDAGAVKR